MPPLDAYHFYAVNAIVCGVANLTYELSGFNFMGIHIYMASMYTPYEWI